MDNNNIELANWYVVHTYSGHENNVKSKIENMIDNGKAHNVFDVKIPMEEYEDSKGAKKERKLFPGYVLIKMIIDSKNWYLIRNTRGVTGFIGPDGEPVPLTPREIRNFGVEEAQAAPIKVRIENFPYKVGDTVEIIEGMFDGSTAEIQEIHLEKQVVIAVVDFIGGLNKSEIPFSYIKQ